jgi:hypothetical protein
MPLIYRPAREQDLERAQELVVRSINDLTERHGFGPMAVLRPTRFQSFSLKDDPDGLWLAEDAGENWLCPQLGLWRLVVSASPMPAMTRRIEGAVWNRRATMATTTSTAISSRSVWIVAVTDHTLLVRDAPPFRIGRG